MSKMRVEIWMGGREHPAYTIEDPRCVEMSMDNTTVKITTDDKWTFETSPQNVVVVSPPEDKR